MRTIRSTVVGLLAVGLAGCYSGLNSVPEGEGESDSSPQDSGEDGPTAAELGPVGVSGVRRLSALEYDATLRDLLGADLVTSDLLLPIDPRAPYDNDYTLQQASQALIEGADLLAADAAAAVVADENLRTTLVGCTPTGPGDEACLREFVARFGRLALRRTLTAAEIERFVAFIDHGEEAGDFYVAVESVLRALLQHPELLYRVERGEPVDGDPRLFRLRGTEVATRLSYFLWGSTPNSALLDLAEAGELDSPQGVEDAAIDMFEDPRARERIGRFHALWMGYEQLPFGPELGDPARAETQALIERVLFEEGRPWQDLLRIDETFVDATLAEHYGLTWPGGDEPQWVGYGNSGRVGLLSQASYLSVGAKFDDTSPTLRGLIVRTRLMCQDIPDPPANVDVDEPPTSEDENACKEQRYQIHADGGCAGCHDLMDPVGFGLENYDAAGRYRETELNRPDCTIAGVGSLDGKTFEGPAGLSEMLLESPALGSCVATQVYRFAMGRYELHQEDHAFLLELQGSVGTSQDFDFDALLLDFVASDAFRYRREEEG